MSDLGLLLKKARTQRGISLEELQELTKIRKRYLEAIEDGDFRVLPGNFYVRAFIKSYSEAVGLDPDEVLRLYRSEIPATEPEPVIEPVRRPRKRKNLSTKFSIIASALVFIAFPILIGGLIYYYLVSKDDSNPANNEPHKLTDKQNANDSSKGPDVKLPDPDKTEPPTKPADPPPTPSQLDFVKKSGNTEYYELSGGKQMVVEINVIGSECWLEIRRGNKSGEHIQSSITLKKDEKRTWTIDSSAYLNLGAASSIELTVNGTKLETSDRSGSKRFQIDLKSS